MLRGSPPFLTPFDLEERGMRIILVRHGEPDYEKNCLTELGRKEARQAAERLMEDKIREIYSSPYGRAFETAKAFSDLSGISEIRTLDFMKEIRFGYGEALYDGGNPWDEVDAMADRGELINDPNWHDWPFFQGNLATSDVDRVMEETDTWMASLGYKRDGLYYRCERETDEEYTVVLFAHGGSLTAMLSRLLNIPFPYLCALVRMRHTAITIIRMNRTPGSATTPVVELLCETRHMGLPERM